MPPPLREPTFLILTALQGQPLHGYALLTEVEGVSRRRVRLRVGTLYAALDRLAQEGLVEVHSEEVVQGRLRRTYAITAAGTRTLVAEADRLGELADAARSRLRERGIVRPSTRAGSPAWGTPR